MQGLIDPPRDTLTEAQVIALIRDEPAIVVDCGLELLDRSLNVLEDISSYLKGGKVSRGNFNTLHGSCDLQLSKTDIDWPSAIGRPYQIISANGVSARFNLGAYFLATPRMKMEENPQTWDVIGYDILHALADKVGASYSVPAGTAYLTRVGEILLARGYTKTIVDQTAAATVLPSNRVWVLDENTTWLTIVNDLLGSIGYQGIWSDWNGYLRVVPYISPTDRAPEWTYRSDQYTSQLAPSKTIEEDYFDAPNKWVAVRQNNVEADPPVEGDGIYTFHNDSVGKTSIASRGRTITRFLRIDAADQASLISAAQISIDADMRVPIKAEVSTSPNPLHWHFDRLDVYDADLGGLLQVQEQEWELDLRGGDMTHKWAALVL